MVALVGTMVSLGYLSCVELLPYGEVVRVVVARLILMR